MSRIGRQPVKLDPKVKVALDGDQLKIEGPKGTLRQSLPQGIAVSIDDGELNLTRSDDSKSQRALHGLARALIANAVNGVHQGFEKKLEIHGVGYTAEAKGKTVNFKLGYSHPVVFPVPDGIDVKIDRNVISVSGISRQQVGQVAADIRALRKPDVYKLKGIRYQGERLRKKAGKAGA